MIFPQFPHQFEASAQARVLKKCSSQLDMSELLLIQQQSDLINELMMKSQASSKNCQTFSTEISELSIDSFEKPRHLNTSISAISLCREYSRYFNEDPTQQVLAEVKNFCSRKTYNFVKSKLRSSIESKLETRVQKQIKHNQQLSQRCLKLAQEVAELQVKLAAANEKVKMQDIKKWQKKEDLNLNLNKSEILIKWQKSIVYKQKVQSELKKSLNKQFKMLQEQKQQNETIRQELTQILQKITNSASPNNSQLHELIQANHDLIHQQSRLCRQKEMDYHRIQDKIHEIVGEMEEMARKLH